MTKYIRCDTCGREFPEFEEDHFTGRLETPTNPTQYNKEVHICCVCLPNLELFKEFNTKNKRKKKKNV